MLVNLINELDIGINILKDVEDELLKIEIKDRALAMTEVNAAEIAKALSEDFKAENGEIPWKELAGMRNIIAHAYGAIDMNMLYDTVRFDFPDLKDKLEQLL